MSTLGTPENPLRVAIVGSGPAGFYAAEALYAAADVSVEVDVIDRLPTPYGLVRAGVAPDHPKIKNVIKRYEKTAGNDAFRFFGNVTVGSDVSPAELAEHYDAVIYAYGAATDRQLGIQGEELDGSHAATEFVAWYNAHPDFAEREFNLDCERVVVIGNGNVAADVARMLTLTREELEETDTAEHAIEALAGASIKEIVVLGRRGPAQAAFTNPEVRELGELLDADIVIDPADVELDPVSKAFMESDESDLTNRKNMDSFTEFASRQPEGKNKRVVLKFFASPLTIEGDGKVERITIARNELFEDHGGAMRARDTGERETIECGLVLRSIGYLGIEIDGVPHDHERGVIRNSEGRVEDQNEHQIPGLYVVGWIKRGPSGVIGTNKKDAQETINNLIEDLEDGKVPDRETDPGWLPELLGERDVDFVSFEGWQAIDTAEVAKGEPLGRPRVKFVAIDEMLDAAKAGTTGLNAEELNAEKLNASTQRG